MSVNRDGKPVFRRPGFTDEQPQLVPESVQDLVPFSDLSRVVSRVVRGLDVGELNGARSGGVSYDPGMLLGLLLFSLADGERSSRRIEKRCRYDARYRLLCGGLVPDHNTIARFRRKLSDVLPSLFAQVLVRAKSLGLVKNREVALDGTKMSSKASQWKKVLAEAEAADADISDPDARTMHTAKGFVTGYNAQAAVDMETGLVLAAHVTNQAIDAPHLPAMVDEIEKVLGSPPESLAADKGYDGSQNASALDERGVTGYISSRDKVWILDDEDRVVCPQGHAAFRRDQVREGGTTYDRYMVRECSFCPHRCHDGNRRLLVVPEGTDPAVWVRQQLRSKGPKGRRMAAARSSSVERFFGFLKGNLGIRRFLLAGLDGANLEFTLACLVYNLKKVVFRPFKAVLQILSAEENRSSVSPCFLRLVKAF
jgi:transposase